jgi:hypothetical protein
MGSLTQKEEPSIMVYDHMRLKGTEWNKDFFWNEGEQGVRVLGSSGSG